MEVLSDTEAICQKICSRERENGRPTNYPRYPLKWKRRLLRRLLDECTRQELAVLGEHLTVYLKEMFPPKCITLDNNGQQMVEPHFDVNLWEIGDVSPLRALARLKRNTSQGMNGIPAMVIKNLGKGARQ